MELLAAILLIAGIWFVYKIYIAYDNIVKELREIRTKCVTEGVSKKEAFVSHISENYMKDSVKTARDNVLVSLKTALAKVA